MFFGQKIISDLAVALTEIKFICPSPKNFQQLAIKGISLKMRELIFEKNDQKLTLCRCTFYSQTSFAKLSSNLWNGSNHRGFFRKNNHHFNYLYVTDSVKSYLEFTRDVFLEIASTSSQNMELFATFGRLLPLHKLTITSEDEQLTLGGVSISSQKELQKIFSMLIKNGIIEDFLEKIVSMEENKEEINSNESKNIFSNDENFIRMKAPDTLSYFTLASYRLKANLSFQKFCLVHDQSNALLFLKDINSPQLNDAVL
ncbi:hypothetical protein ACTFIW_010319 [Dictyostelium discoideum]